MSGAPSRARGDFAPGSHGLVAAGLTWLVRAYQWLLSPVLGPSCRFLPTCSEYAVDALAAHGALRGSLLAARRVLRCHPWGDSGYDPVPTPGDRNHPTRDDRDV